jgi:hypothetical protein
VIEKSMKIKILHFHCDNDFEEIDAYGKDVEKE